MAKKIFDFIKKYQYIVYFLLSIGIFDIVIRFQYRTNLAYRFLTIEPIMFTIGSALLFLVIFILLPKRGGRIFYIIILSIFSILFLTHTIFQEHFGYYFQFAFLGQAQEGLTYAESYIRIVPLISWLTVLFVAGLATLTIITYKVKENTKKISIVCTVCSIFAILTASYFLNTEYYIERFLKELRIDAFSNFRDTNSRFSISGFYVYTFMDILHQFSRPNYVQSELAKKVDEFLENNDYVFQDNDYTGIFKDKNLIFVMLENIEHWMINENTTPTMYKMMNEGINFINNYSPLLASGATFTSEFIMNTGFIPEIGSPQPAFRYADIYLPHTLPSLFKNAGYIVNSYHQNHQRFYNRGINHYNWGYSKYFTYEDMGIESSKNRLDRYIAINGYDKIVFDEKFMSFVITISGHLPFEERKDRCYLNLDFVTKYKNVRDTLICGYAYARETDLMFYELIKRLERDKRLEDTVIVAFTDHFSISINIREDVKNKKGLTLDDENLLSQTPFFIWKSDFDGFEYTDVTSTVDVLPTVANLFGLDWNPRYFIGKDAFSTHRENFVFFRDRSWYDGTTYFKNGQIQFGDATNEYIEKMNRRVRNNIDFSFNVLHSDYFRLRK